MSKKRTYKVKEVAKLAGVSVRALHHYEEIGLLVPSERTHAGYRLYCDADLLRLQQVMLGRSLGLSLSEVRTLLDDEHRNRRDVLLTQRAQLAARAQETQAMIRAVDAALASLDERGHILKEEAMTTTDMKDLFQGFDPTEHEQEAQEKWGNTDSYQESMKRTKSYTKEDWKRQAAEHGEIYDAAAVARSAGAPADGGVAMDVAERHRLAIDAWFYPCSKAAHAGLADLYEGDARFAAHIDKHGAGLTAYLVTAIRANAKR